MDGAFLAGCFGLDTRKYTVGPSVIHSSHARKDCTPLYFTCLSCERQFEFSGLAAGNLSCAYCNASFSAVSAEYQLHALLRKLQNDLYQQWGECDECHAKFRTIRIYPKRCLHDDCSGSVILKVFFLVFIFHRQPPNMYIIIFYLICHCLTLSVPRTLIPVVAIIILNAYVIEERLSTIYSLSQELEPCVQLMKQRIATSAYPIINLQQLFRFIQ